MKYAKQFKLNHLRIDVDRCNIVDGNSTISVEPRSMDVLAFLAEHPHKVISQQTLFDALWPNTLFNPGAVQRCIAQLRKAMGDDAQAAKFIITHSKRGYSLDVVPEYSKDKVFNRYLYFGITLISLVLAVIGTYLSTHSEPGDLSGNLIPITSTSHYDFYPTYSNDGKTLAFIRQQNGQAHIILKDMTTGQERVVTSQPHDYQSIVWKGNKSLVFIVRDQKDGDWVGQVQLAKKGSQMLFRLTEKGSLWRVFPKQDSLVYMHVHAPINKSTTTYVKTFNLISKQHTELLKSSSEFTPYRIAISSSQSMLAIAGESTENQIEFRIFDLHNNTLSAPFATMPLGFTQINWHPDDQSILVQYLNKLYQLSLDGELIELPYKNYQRIFNAVYHPDGSAITMSLTEHDTDLLTYDSHTEELHKIIDSSSEDSLARLSPINDDVAFVSSRAGKQQLWLYQNGHEESIFDNPDNLPIYRAPVWSNDGNTIAFSFSQSLFNYSIETGSLVKYSMPSIFTAVLDWFSNNRQLLIVIKQDNISYFAKYDLFTNQITRLTKTGVHFSAKLDNKDNLVFYRDDVLHWGELTFSLDEFPKITGSIYPVENELVFQSDQTLYKFDGNKLEVVIKQLPEETKSLADAITFDSFLFNSQASRQAKIIDLR